jgi:hypothetical protein
VVSLANQFLANQIWHAAIMAPDLGNAVEETRRFGVFWLMFG